MTQQQFKDKTAPPAWKTREAFAYLESGHPRGKVVVSIKKGR